MPFEVKNEIAIITGSAQGFGKEFAKRLLQKGAKVCISDVNEEQGLKTIEELGKAYGKDGVTFKRYYQWLLKKFQSQQLFESARYVYVK